MFTCMITQRSWDLCFKPTNVRDKTSVEFHIYKYSMDTRWGRGLLALKMHKNSNYVALLIWLSPEHTASNYNLR